MLKTLGAVGAILLGLAGSAQARLTPGRALLRAASVAAEPAASCPAGMPTQTITVINQAGASRFALAKVENAMVAQSLQLRAAWGTPCVVFGGGGWPLYLKIGGAEPHGEHDFYGQPYALVWTSGADVEGWSRDFSHEVIEMLEDPNLDVRYLHDGSTWHREIADPVEGLGYRLDGVYVSDFVTPTWYAGASTGSQITCSGITCADDSPLISPTANTGPWDEMGVLTGPWQNQLDT